MLRLGSLVLIFGLTCKQCSADQYHTVFVAAAAPPVVQDDTSACGSSAERPCHSVKAALLAFPRSLPVGTRPRVLLLPGLFDGLDNVNLGAHSCRAGIENVLLEGSGQQLTTLSCADNFFSTTRVGVSMGCITSLSNLTITDCASGGVSVNALDTFAATLDSVTVSKCGGASELAFGGGVQITGSVAAVLTNCTLLSNSATTHGGGLSAAGNASVTLTSTVVEGNRAWSGAGISVDSSSLTLSSCTVRSNVADTAGGGLLAVGSALSLSDSSLVRNTAAGASVCEEDRAVGCSGRGGGAAVTGGTAELHRVSVQDNVAQARQSRDDYARGGGLFLRDTVLTAKVCVHYVYTNYYHNDHLL
jgi:hypothetical protein